MTQISEIPWMIEGGAVHSVQVARNLAYMAAGGTGGIVRGAHLEVRETAVPGSSVRVFPGVAAVPNRAAGAESEMYVFWTGAEELVPIAPTGSGGGRTDLIVARVENPHASGETWPDPADPAVGPYASLAVISNVPAGTNSVDDLGLSADHSMIALARIEIPASTSTITQAMVTDLRVMANAVSKRTFDIATPSAAETLTSGTYVNWPTEADQNIDIPEWATHARLRAILSGVKHGASGNNGGAGWNVFGELRFRVGGAAGDITSQSTSYNISHEQGRDRATLMVAAPKVPLPTVDRGSKGVLFQIQGKKNGGSTSLTSENGTTVSFEVEFINEPETNV